MLLHVLTGPGGCSNHHNTSAVAFLVLDPLCMMDQQNYFTQLVAVAKII